LASRKVLSMSSAAVAVVQRSPMATRGNASAG
jgi:hypothetical protein